jgi:hypothetical protein
MEGNWSYHWHHMLELPKGKVLCDIDGQGDIFKAKKEIGFHQCIAGGVRDSHLIYSTPEEVREHVKLCCETLGEGGGYIISGPCNFPYETNPRNLRALVDAVMEFGWYDKSIKAMPMPSPAGTIDPAVHPRRVTPWSLKKEELGGSVTGVESLIERPWDSLEAAAYVWLWQWVL